jgi:hypothetical protein
MNEWIYHSRRTYILIHSYNTRNLSLHTAPNSQTKTPSNPPITHTLRTLHLSALPSLLAANQRNNPRQLRALRELLLLGLLVHIPTGRNVVAHLEHAVLQRKQLRQRVVQERRAEGDVGGRLAVVGQAHFELARGLLGAAAGLDGGRGLGLLGGLLAGSASELVRM